MGQIWDFLRPVSEHFGLGEPKCTETDLNLKSPRFVPFRANLTQFKNQIALPAAGVPVRLRA